MGASAAIELARTWLWALPPETRNSLVDCAVVGAPWWDLAVSAGAVAAGVSRPALGWAITNHITGGA